MSGHYGADAQTAKVQKLVEKKAQLEAALPVVDDSRAMAIEARLDKIEAQIRKEIAHAKAIGNVAAIKAAMGIDGIGGLEFQTQAPPGIGRLLRLPFFPNNGATTGYITGAGDTTASATVPVVSAAIPSGYGKAIGAGAVNQLGAFTMNTPQVSWATLRIVGFEVDIHNYSTVAPNGTIGITSGGAAAIAAADGVAVQPQNNAVPAPKLIVQDLKIGGGANLFTHEDYADAEIYDVSQPEFCGLRDYPILKSPNTCQVTIGAIGCGSSDTDALVGLVVAPQVDGSQTIAFSCALLCEVLQDDNYGSHIPGPYARKGAMVRKGGSFV
jgi:hypothetical protein